jgi:hypothetical protein
LWIDFPKKDIILALFPFPKDLFKICIKRQKERDMSGRKVENEYNIRV